MLLIFYSLLDQMKEVFDVITIYVENASFSACNNFGCFGCTL